MVQSGISETAAVELVRRDCFHRCNQRGLFTAHKCTCTRRISISNPKSDSPILLPSRPSLSACRMAIFNRFTARGYSARQ